MFWIRLKNSLDMIKFEHSVFALPFALTGAVLAFRGAGVSFVQSLPTVSWIVVAMVSARAAAMAFNRLIDHQIDGRNPRTSMRHLPAGLLTRRYAVIFIVAASTLFLFAAWELNPLCFRLAPIALALVFFYSYTKRFTSLSHVVLGVCLGIAPSAAWIAVRGSLAWPILLLTVAVMFWVAGFDIIYSCQDYEFDTREGLHSLPAAIGIGPALLVARFLHLAMLIALCALAARLHLGVLSALGIAAIAAILLYEHSIVRPSDLSRVNAAFFTMNGWVSIVFFLFWTADTLLLP